MLLLLRLLLLFVLAVAFTPPHTKTKVRPSSSKSNQPGDISFIEAQRNIIVLSHNVSQDVADGLFDVNDLLIGRVDVLARCVNSALWVSHGIRKDTSVFIMLFPHNITVEVRGKDVQNLNPDERTIALYLQRTLLAVASKSNETATKRRHVELQRLQQTERKRPETVNPNKPGSLSKSEKRAFRTIRQSREAMIRRITRSSGDKPPLGFVVHHGDSLKARLQNLKGPVLMLDELGEPLGDVLLDCANTNIDADTNIILADQTGYAAYDEMVLAESDAVRQVSLGSLSLLTSQCITIAHHYLDARKENNQFLSK